MNVTPLENADIDRMMSKISNTFAIREHRKTIRHRVGAVAVAVALVGTATGGALAITQASSTMKTVAECYSAASLDAKHTGAVLLAPDGHPNPQFTDDKARIKEGIEMCAAVWHIGQFDAAAPSTSASNTPHVPDLIACTLADGRFGYFPSSEPAEEVCGDLGLTAAR